MRLWSLHPRYLDRQGLLALWREGLLARAVLKGATRGYRFHPQLDRFRVCSDPVAALDEYLRAVVTEAGRRGYRFAADKIGPQRQSVSFAVTQGQLRFEREHLLRKLQRRNPAAARILAGDDPPEAHPLMQAVPGDREPWERGAGKLRPRRE